MRKSLSDNRQPVHPSSMCFEEVRLNLQYDSLCDSYRPVGVPELQSEANSRDN